MNFHGRILAQNRQRAVALQSLDGLGSLKSWGFRLVSRGIWLRVGIVDESPAPQREKPQGKNKYAWSLLILATIVLVVGVAIGPVQEAPRPAYRNALMQRAQQVGQVMFSYAADNTANGNAYPDGKSSTEIFQMLMDQGYVTDPNVFYVPMLGKVKPEGAKLRPENVCWDVAVPVGPNDSDSVPLVYLTGYRVTFAAGAAAVPIIKPFPDYFGPHWWLSPDSLPGFGIAVFYKGNKAMWIKGRGDSIPNFVPTDFDAKGKTYRQLTPDGVLK